METSKALLVYVVSYFIIIFVVPSILVYKRSGTNPFLFRRTDSAHDYIGMHMRWMTAATFLVIVVNAFAPQGSTYFVSIEYLEQSVVDTIGVICLSVSLLWIVIAEYHMGKSWRIGFDDNERTDLVVTGPFRYSRNPVFLGMMVTQIGIFMVIPSAVTLTITVAVFYLLQIQVRLEEEHLKKSKGVSYSEYLKRVRRWI